MPRESKGLYEATLHGGVATSRAVIAANDAKDAERLVRAWARHVIADQSAELELRQVGDAWSGVSRGVLAGSIEQNDS